MDRLLRHGAGPDVAELYDRVRVAVQKHRSTGEALIDYPKLLDWIAEAFDRCEITDSDFEAKVQEFKETA